MVIGWRVPRLDDILRARAFRGPKDCLSRVEGLGLFGSVSAMRPLAGSNCRGLAVLSAGCVSDCRKGTVRIAGALADAWRVICARVQNGDSAR